jgi:SAM-dependent MidA family methyltransferase
MTPAGELLAAEIRRGGPIPFRRFMQVALYDPTHGYYRRSRDPFGVQGDFYTAEQLQPVFGILVAARIRALYEEMNRPAAFHVVELGAGRREMEKAFSEWNYIPVDIDCGMMPERFTGVVFANEFFDALPVDVALYHDGVFREQRVTLRADGFAWETAGPVEPELEEYFRNFLPEPQEGCWYEANRDALAWIDRVAGALEAGFVFTIDYGYTLAEAVRFPRGTLMGYRRHTAIENVLCDPGERDITAHVNFTALDRAGAARGFRNERFETLAQTILAAGEPDQFAAALGSDDPRRRLQLKTLLFGMGETFRVLLQRREVENRTGGKSLNQ